MVSSNAIPAAEAFAKLDREEIGKVIVLLWQSIAVRGGVQLPEHFNVQYPSNMEVWPILYKLIQEYNLRDPITWV